MSLMFLFVARRTINCIVIHVGDRRRISPRRCLDEFPRRGIRQDRFVRYSCLSGFSSTRSTRSKLEWCWSSMGRKQNNNKNNVQAENPKDSRSRVFDRAEESNHRMYGTDEFAVSTRSSAVYTASPERGRRASFSRISRCPISSSVLSFQFPASTVLCLDAIQSPTAEKVSTLGGTAPERKSTC